MKVFKFLLVLLCSGYCVAVNGQQRRPSYLNLAPAINAVNLVMIHDVTSPPAAARYYAYIMMAAYQLVAENNKEVVPLHAFIKSFPADDTPPATDFDYRIAAKYSILETAKNMLPSGYMLQEDEDEYVKLLKLQLVDAKVIQRSIEAGEKASAAIIEFSKGDHYNRLSAALRYTPKGEGYWYPTPPAYFEAVEPNWNMIRPLMIDSASQFKPKVPLKFAKDSASAFYKLAKEVYNSSLHLTPQQRTIAAFWDCNPFAVTTSGHMSIGFKKISPGGHWMNIAVLAVNKAGLDFDRSVEVVTVVGVGLMDSFIACWDEKYRSNRIRPETYINKYIDVTWRPFLQTPPFPENTSGHAVISNTAANLLTYLLGDHFAYTDNTEAPFGVTPRNFSSFKQAASEASISRFYGGIHYHDSIADGNKQGIAVAEDLIAKLKKAGIEPVR